MTSNPTEDAPFEGILRQYRRGWVHQTVRSLWLLGLILISFIVVELLNVERMMDGVPAMVNLLSEMLPPDFSRFPQWIEPIFDRSEEHTSELQSLTNLVCRLLLEKKKNNYQLSSIIQINNNNWLDIR